MEDHSSRGSVLVALALLCFFSGGAESARVFTIVNRCKTSIWPAAIPGDSFGGGGFELQPGQSAVFKAPVSWTSGRIWARTECSFDSRGNGTCATGSCGPTLKCGVAGATPASLAEFTLAGSGGKDYYDVSLVDGFNLPVLITPVNGKGNCSAAGCVGDLRDDCPPELAVKVGGRTVACRSACDVFDTDKYCCRGIYGGPKTCNPTVYSNKFKDACPTAYSYAYDDPSSLFTCFNADYIITFCSSRKHSECSYHNHRLVCSGSNWRWPSSMSSLVHVLLFSVLSSQIPV
ncbi:hypothetical protein QOZ80_4BG0359960 [Eleusine coracana subsp. coracana]|nr:hypothetical protein QOZ80_4BG0359960 [Eleusine coracana subsp. coracana]